MKRLDDIHLIAYDKLQQSFSLNPVTLQHPLPERSLRALGLVKIDGTVLSSEQFLRVLILQVTVACLREVRTIFLGPRVELDLPVFSSETILMGKNRIIFLDVYLALVKQTRPLTGEALEQARRDYDAYTSTVIDHDPAAKIYSTFR